MARPLRVEYAGAYYHVTGRGVARQEIFYGDADRQEFLETVAETHERFGLVFHGYCLMRNHLEVETPAGELSRPLQWLNHKYASYVNRTQERVGHLFQGRFKSAVVEASGHLRELTRYIHLNPVRAGVVSHPGDYRWSSYRAYLGVCKRPSWLTVDKTLKRFGATRKEQRSRYREFVEQPEEVVQDPLRELVLGTRDFVDWVRVSFWNVDTNAEVAQLTKARPQVSLAAVCAAVCASYGCEEEVLRQKRKHANHARDVAVYLARRHGRHRLTELGEWFGGVSTPAVSLTCQRVEKKLLQDRQLRRRVADLDHQLASSFA